MNFDDGFLGFAREALALEGKRLARHQALLVSRLQDVADGAIDRLTVQMPPGAAKSTCASVLFPVYWFARRPGSAVIAVGHTASLASHFSRSVREAVDTHGERLGMRLKRSLRMAAEFKLENGSHYFATGVRGPIMGRHADLILIDDPIKSWMEAENASQRDALWDWYRGALVSRLKPGGCIVVAMTRWHEDDLVGRLLASGDAWRALCLPAIAGADDPLGRLPGEALWPEHEPIGALERRRASLGERAFAALYQQAPRRPEQGYFAVEKIGVGDGVPDGAGAVVRAVRAWDLAASAGEAGGDPDWTVGLKLGLTEAGRFVVLDIRRARRAPGQVERMIADAARDDGVETLIALPQDPGQAGKAQVEYLRRCLAGYRVVSSPETGAKTVRAMQAAAAVDAGRMSLAPAAWNRSFLMELGAFPDGGKDDQVDAFARAVTSIGAGEQRTRRLSVSLIGR